MNIVDAQIHMGPGGIEEVLAAMDALGIRAVLIDEYWLRNFNNEPHHNLPLGAYRPVCPTAELAAQTWPERFSYMLRIHRMDPDYASIVRQMRDAPNGRALRIVPGMSPEEAREFADGGYDHILSAAADCGLPIFVFSPDQPDAFSRAARAFSSLRIIVDHCGIFSNSMRATIGGAPALSDEQQQALFEKVLALSDFPNIAIKWGHASELFETPAWPGDGLWPVMRRAISSFGADRIMWASDYSVNQRGESWAELLFGVLGDPNLSELELEAVLGGTVRTWLDWPA